MNEITFASTDSIPQTEAEYEAVLARLFDEIRLMNEQIREDQNEIDRFKRETAIYRAQSQQLKAEGEQLSSEIRARLKGLHVALDRMTGVV